MFQSLSALTSIITGSLDIFGKAKGWRREKKRQRLARALHLIYLRLNECLVTAEQIVEVLDAFVKNPTSVSYSGEYHINAAGVELDGLLRQQEQQLQNLADSVEDYSEILRALDAELYLKIKQFTAFKGVGVRWLGYLIRQGRVPFDSLDADDTIHLAQFSRYMLPSKEADAPDDNPLRRTFEEFLPWYNQVAEISRRLDANSFQLGSLFKSGEYDPKEPANLDQVEVLRQCLRRNDLRHHLDEAKLHLTTIKSFIEVNFSVVDLMLDVGSEQLRKKPDW